MYVTEGMNCYKVYWRDENSKEEHHFFSEGLNESEVETDAHTHIKKLFMGRYSILKVVLHRSNKWYKAINP